MKHQIERLLESKILNLTTSKDHIIPGSLIVAFDLEFSIQGISEAGIAFLQIPITKKQPAPTLPADNTLRTFYAQNSIQTYSVQVREKIKKKTNREAVKYGSTIVVDDEDFSTTIFQLLSSENCVGSLILVGFSLNTEFKWISESCPRLASLFTAWVDLQEIIMAENHGISQPGLLNSMNGMNITDRRSGTNPPSKHRASNDAVRCLVVLAGVISLESLVPLQLIKPSKHVPLALLSRLPTPSRRYPFTARVTTADGGILPPHYNTPISLYGLFERYAPNAVALNSRGGLPKSNGWKVWWLSFPSTEALRKFSLETSGSDIDGRKVVVENITID